MAKETTLGQDKKFVAGPLKDNSMCIDTDPRFHKPSSLFVFVLLFVKILEFQTFSYFLAASRTET